MSNTTYSTKEQAEKYGKIEADKLTSRGYPTTLIEVRKVTKTILALEGQSPSEMGYMAVSREGWEAILS